MVQQECRTTSRVGTGAGWQSSGEGVHMCIATWVEDEPKVYKRKLSVLWVTSRMPGA